MSDLVDNAVQLVRMQCNARLAMHYRACFLADDGTLHVHGQKVLADWNRFCRVNVSAFDADQRIHALLEGRREVALRTLNFLRVDSAELAKFVEVKDE